MRMEIWVRGRSKRSIMNLILSHGRRQSLWRRRWKSLRILNGFKKSSRMDWTRSKRPRTEISSSANFQNGNFQISKAPRLSLQILLLNHRLQNSHFESSSGLKNNPLRNWSWRSNSTSLKKHPKGPENRVLRKAPNPKLIHRSNVLNLEKIKIPWWSQWNTQIWKTRLISYKPTRSCCSQIWRELGTSPINISKAVQSRDSKWKMIDFSLMSRT